MEQVLAALLEHGPLGVVLAIVGTAYWRQSEQLRDVQAARVEDAKKTITTLLELVDKQHASLESIAEVVGELKAAIERNRRL